MTQNVVTYTVVVATDNSDGKLLPYLTANLQFEVEQHDDVLLVPNAALRWKPRAAADRPRRARRSRPQAAVAARKAGKRRSPAEAKACRRRQSRPSPPRNATSAAALWVQDGRLRPARRRASRRQRRHR